MAPSVSVLTGFDCILKNSPNIVFFYLYQCDTYQCWRVGGNHENKGLEEYGRLERKRREEGVLKGCGAGQIGGKFTRILTTIFTRL